MKLKDTPQKKSYDQPRQHIKKQRLYFDDISLSSQRYGFSNSHVWMWELDHKEGWMPKNGFFQILVLEKTFESALDCKDIQPVHPKGNQSWIFIGRTDAEAETPILWPPDVKDWLIRIDPSAGKYWRWEEKGMMEDEMVGWHHQLNGHDLSKLQELVMYREGSLACFSPWGRKELDTTEWLMRSVIPYTHTHTHTHTHTYIWERERIGSSNYGGFQVPRCENRNLETQERWLCSFQIYRSAGLRCRKSQCFSLS